MTNRGVAKAFLPYALLASALFILLQSIPIGVGIVTIALSLIWYSSRCSVDITNVEFLKLHDIPHHRAEVSALVTSQWPVPVTAEGIEEANFVRTSSLNESCDTLPCHLLALASKNGIRQVVAHCVLRETSSSRPQDINRYLKMLKIGLPHAAVQQAMETAGLDPSKLPDHLEEVEFRTTHNLGELQNVNLSALVVKPEFRGRGLGKAMCAYAAQVASGLGAQEVIGGCLDELLPFYGKLGVKKRSAKTREGIPKIRLGNEMFLTLDDDVLKKAEKMLDESKKSK